MLSALRQWFYFGWPSETRRKIETGILLTMFAAAIVELSAALWWQSIHGSDMKVGILAVLLSITIYTLVIGFRRRKTIELLFRESAEESFVVSERAVLYNRMILHLWAYFIIASIFSYLGGSRLGR